MADLPISGLPSATSLDGTELLAAVQGSSTTKTTSQDIRDINTPLTASGITVGNGSIVPTTPQGATLGTLEKPFSELYLQSGSISIESDTPGDLPAIISNKGGNLEINTGGMRLVEPGASFVATTGSFSYLSGSFTHIGSANRVGNTIVTGSFAVSGSTITIGNNTLTGNTILSGSVEINGYTPLATASISDTTITFTKVDSSTFDIDLPSAYGSFYDTTTQSGSADTAYAIKINSTTISSGVSIANNGSGFPTRITILEGGIYSISSKQQFLNAGGGGSDQITEWLSKNGTNVANSSTIQDIEKELNEILISPISHIVSASAGDYYELMWSVDSSDVTLEYTGPQTNPTRPAAPSVITTVNRVG